MDDAIVGEIPGLKFQYAVRIILSFMALCIFALIDSTSAVQRNECCLAKCTIVSGIMAQLMGLLLTYIMSTLTLVPFIESLSIRSLFF